MVIQCLQQRWLPLFGSPNGVLCDHGGAFIGSKFINYVNKILSSRLIYASVEYPRGNGLNESSHRILETAIESHPDWAGLMFPEILSNCVLIYNSSPNISIGNTPAALVYGKDPRLPGLEVFNQEISEEERQTKVKELRLWPILKEQLKSFQEEKVQFESSEKSITPGSIVTYRLSETERDQYEHVSKEKSYRAVRSMPQRVIKTLDKSVILTPL